MGNSTPPRKIVTREKFILKLGARDYVDEVTHHAHFGSIGTVGASPQIGEILSLCDF